MVRRSLILMLLVTPMVAQHAVTLTWSDPDTGVTYNIYRGSAQCSSNPTFAVVNTAPITALTFTDSGMAVGKYCYYATAVDAASGLESLPSNMVDAKVLPHPPTLNPPVVN